MGNEFFRDHGEPEDDDYVESDEADVLDADTPTSIALTPAESQAAEIKRGRARAARRIKVAVETLHKLETNSDADDTEEDTEMPPKTTYQCPRYEEIKEYLIRQRGPEELALDTMGILSEPAFYRYVRDRVANTGDGFQPPLRAMEFRAFLAEAQERMELFM